MEQKTDLRLPIIVLVIAVVGVLIFVQSLSNQYPTPTGAFQTNLSIQDFNNTLIVTVLDCANSNPIASATVRLYNLSVTKLNSTTNSSGKFQTVNLEPLNYTIEAEKSGYTSINVTSEVTANATISATITLPPCGGAPPSGGAAAPGTNPLATIGYVGKRGPDVLTVHQGETTNFVVIVYNIGNTPLTNIRLTIEGFPEIPFAVTSIERVIIKESDQVKNFTIPLSKNPLAKGALEQQGLPPVTGALLLQGETQNSNEGVFTITPEIINIVPPGARLPFYIEMRVPVDTPPGNYTLLARAITKETTFSKPILLEVLPAERKPAVLLLADEIEFLRRSINEIYGEALFINKKGGDVSEAVGFLRLGNKSLDRALEYKQASDAESMRTEIETARSLIRAAVELLAKVRIPFFDILQAVIFIIIIVFVLLITLIAYLKHEQKRTYNRIKDILQSIRRLKSESGLPPPPPPPDSE